MYSNGNDYLVLIHSHTKQQRVVYFNKINLFERTIIKFSMAHHLPLDYELPESICQTKNVVLENQKVLYKTKDFSDCIIILSDGEVQAHKFVLIGELCCVSHNLLNINFLYHITYLLFQQPKAGSLRISFEMNQRTQYLLLIMRLH